MEQKSDFRRPGEKENEMLLVKLTKTQKQRIRMLAESSGYKSISDYVRFMLLNPSLEEKFNQIMNADRITKETLIKIMQELQNGIKY
jgi:Arc/MetJ-type ribon-helix-helix transcriptional regulator